MTHAEEIFRAVVRLTQVHGREEFSRADVRRQLGVENDTFQSRYTAIFQGMRSDHPGGAPQVGEEFVRVFRRVAYGRYVLTDKGRGLLGPTPSVRSSIANHANPAAGADSEIAEGRFLRPSSSLMLKYLGDWEQLENYRLQEASLGLLFHSLCPENKKIEHVLLKVSALNDFYSTNIFDTYSVAKHILKKDIDAQLEASDYSLVNDIAQISIKGKTKNFYSFASKYCSHHKPNNYPIFDSFVEKMLLHYKSTDRFNGFDKSDLKKYEDFIEIIKSFRSFYKLEKYSLREIDIFLWLAGKEWFPKNYR